MHQPGGTGCLAKAWIAGSLCAQGCADVIQRNAVGFSTDGSSIVPALIAQSCGLPSSAENIGVPHSGQNCRITWLPESPLTVNPFTVPLVSLNDALGTTATAAGSPPEIYWQSRQWQSMKATGSADAS